MTQPVRKARAYSYLRFSSPEQAKGASKRRQIEAAAKWAAEHDLELDEELRDEGVSAFKGRNRDPTSALGGFLARVKSGEVEKGSYLLVENFDRLSREEVVDALELFLGLTRSGIVVVTLADGRVYDRESLRTDSTQLIISIVVMARAYEESATKSRRVGDAWSRKREAARARGQAMTATCPGWIRLVGGPREGRYELIAERAELVRRFFAETIAGDGRRTIANRLNAQGEPVWGLAGNKGMYWHDSYVAKVLTSPATFGRYDKGDDRIAGYFPVVVDEATFWRAQAATASRSVGRGTTAKHFANLLHGLATCPACGGAMVYVDKGKRSSGPVLRCAKAHARAGCDMRTAVPYVSELLLLHCYAHFADAAMFAMEHQARDASREVDALNLRRSDLVMRRDRLVQAIEEGGPIPTLRKRMDELGLEIARIDRDAAALSAIAASEEEMEADIEVRMDLLREKIEAEDPEERYRARSDINARLRRFVDRIVVLEDGRIEFVFKPEFEGITARMFEQLWGRSPEGAMNGGQRTEDEFPPA